MTILSEEEYLSQNGACYMSMGDVSLHRQPGSTPKSRHKAATAQAARDHALIIRRARLREEYAAKVAAGEIRPPTVIERLTKTAKGHPDNESVHAARRILKRRFGIEIACD